MIYRILVDEKWDWDEENSEAVLRPVPILKGPGSALADIMWEMHLPAPDLSNPRVRFYFTKLGWRKIGRLMASAGKKRGYLVKVIRRRTPQRSQIVYRDKLQMTILPDKRKKG